MMRRHLNRRSRAALIAGALVVVTALAVAACGATRPPKPVGGSAAPAPSVSGEATAGVPDPSASAAAPSSAAPSASATSGPKPSPNAPLPPPPAGSKKGVSTYDFAGNEQALKNVRVSWYYNWSPNRTKTGSDPGVEFVPMIWGTANVNAATLNAVKSQGTHLLGFNEPDFKDQSNITPEKALELWPQLQNTGLRLGSPSVAFGGDRAGGWLDTFMSGAQQRGYRVDFITLHWYGGDFSSAAVGQLRGYIEAVHNRYHKPIWLTEFALMRFEGGGAVVPTQAQQVAFVKGATAMLQSLSYVERYAWFSLPAKDANSTGLYSSGTTTTEVGAAYRAVD
jgi:hypothetical protein